jgi:hypothetical protein
LGRFDAATKEAAVAIRIGIQATDAVSNMAFGKALASYLGFAGDERRASVLAPLAIEYNAGINAVARLLEALPE